MYKLKPMSWENKKKTQEATRENDLLFSWTGWMWQRNVCPTLQHGWREIKDSWSTIICKWPQPLWRRSWPVAPDDWLLILTEKDQKMGCDGATSFYFTNIILCYKHIGKWATSTCIALLRGHLAQKKVLEVGCALSHRHTSVCVCVC